MLWSLEICWLNESRLILFFFLVFKNTEVTAHAQVTLRLFTMKTGAQWWHMDPLYPEKSILRSGAGMSLIQISTSPCSKQTGVGKGILPSRFTSPGERIFESLIWKASRSPPLLHIHTRSEGESLWSTPSRFSHFSPPHFLCHSPRGLHLISPNPSYYFSKLAIIYFPNE